MVSQPRLYCRDNHLHSFLDKIRQRIRFFGDNLPYDCRIHHPIDSFTRHLYEACPENAKLLKFRVWHRGGKRKAQIKSTGFETNRCFCARDRTRTDKDVNPIEPETIASTNFATRALHRKVTHNFHNTAFGNKIFAKFVSVKNNDRKLTPRSISCRIICVIMDITSLPKFHRQESCREAMRILSWLLLLQPVFLLPGRKQEIRHRG